MPTSEIKEFPNKSMLYAQQKLRKGAKEAGYKVTFDNYPGTNEQQLRFSAQRTYEEKGINIEYGFEKQNIIFLRHWFGFSNESSLNEFVLEYINTVAAKTNSELIVFRTHKYNELFLMNPSYGFKKEKAHLVCQFPSDGDSKEEAYYLELKGTVVQKKRSAYEVFSEVVLNLNQGRNTYKSEYGNSGVLGYNQVYDIFYYDGIEGQITISFDNPFTISFLIKEVNKSGASGTFQHVDSQVIEDASQIEPIITKWLQTTKEDRKLVTLIEPPRKFFNDYCWKHLSLSKEKSKPLFEKLVEVKKAEPEIIEIMIKHEENQTAIRYMGCGMIKLLDLFIVVNCNNDSFEFFSCRDGANQYFHTSCIQTAENNHEKKLLEEKQRHEEVLKGIDKFFTENSLSKTSNSQPEC